MLKARHFNISFSIMVLCTEERKVRTQTSTPSLPVWCLCLSLCAPLSVIVVSDRITVSGVNKRCWIRVSERAGEGHAHAHSHICTRRLTSDARSNYSNTLTSHFISSTALVACWTSSLLQNHLNSWCHRFNQVLETFLRGSGPRWHDSIISYISCSTTSQSCCTGLRSGGCRGHWSTVNSLSCSRNQFEMIMVHHPAGSIDQKMVHCGHEGMDMVSNKTEVGCGV